MTDEWSIISRYTRRPPVDVVSIIRELGILYREKPMRPEQSGYFARHGNTYEIGVNSIESEQRKRFTAAHELGHYILHRDLLMDGEHFDRLFGASARSNPTWPFTRHHEIQANAFAADIIMPADLVTTTYRNNGNNITLAAERFDVSQKAMAFRLKNLNAIYQVPPELL